jgi:hypothetical protein
VRRLGHSGGRYATRLDCACTRKVKACLLLQSAADVPKICCTITTKPWINTRNTPHAALDECWRSQLGENVCPHLIRTGVEEGGPLIIFCRMLKHQACHSGGVINGCDCGPVLIKARRNVHCGLLRRARPGLMYKQWADLLAQHRHRRAARLELQKTQLCSLD